MGRQVKRVPLDFDWPTGKIWYGYMLDICDDDCENCRKFARMVGKEVRDDRCPNFKIEVPIGDGWQMWEDTSEGSPISPVFDTPEKLARWLADTNASALGDDGATYEHWLGMITGPGYANSAVIVGGEFINGVEWAGR